MPKIEFKQFSKLEWGYYLDYQQKGGIFNKEGEFYFFGGSDIKFNAEELTEILAFINLLNSGIKK